jgi:hypothetical protein
MDFTNLWFGAGHGGGEVGWFRFTDHVLLTLGSWSLLAFPVTQPDVGSFPSTLVTSFFIDYGLYIGAQAASVASGTVDFGPVSTSTGHVSESLIQFLLGQLNVKYIVMDKSIQSDLYPELNVTPYQEAFANWTRIVPVKTFDNLVVYENPLFGSIVSIPSRWIQVTSLDLLPQRFSQTSLGPSSSAFVVGNESDIPLHSSNATIESFSQVSPTSFVVRAHAFGNFLLALSTAFDTRWEAVVEGGVVNDHFAVDTYANGWTVSGSGEMTIRIDYGPQESYQAAILISIGSILVVLAVLVIEQVRTYRTRRLIGQHTYILASHTK